MINVVGLGDGGFAELPEPLQRLVARARVLLGAPRHLALVPAVHGQVRAQWPRPLVPTLPEFLARQLEAVAEAGEPADDAVVALASGDPLTSGIGTTLVHLLGAEAVRVHPALPSPVLARARMGWSTETTTVVSVVGRSLATIRRHLDPGERLVVLCSDGSTPAAVAELLREAGCGASTVTAWWHLGGPDEGGRSATAELWDPTPTPDLVLLCVQVDPVGALARPAGPVPGRPESAFDNDGQITKRDLRASALASLRPTPGAHLWDLGAGSGAVGIEWVLAARRARATAVERDPSRAQRIRGNADALGAATDVEVVTAEAAAAIAALEPPDAVFVGGGLTADVVERAWERLLPGGRMVAHAVTLGTEAVIVAACSRFGGRLTRISVEHAQPLGAHLSWTPSRPVVQWSATKPLVGPTAPSPDARSVET
ncbi:precorrin-6y C5,15-methyltransferase (decarboxylating) subunit CbiE [Pedococcus sp. NPDC057267]|uniref:precorrin-6y C5,15-methyltransferase (decarboxylating) subunit CbiE n=1 Tax=Pedococcus sp. NPDC057267 TaxID=3346077 RepID=UPI00362FE565